MDDTSLPVIGVVTPDERITLGARRVTDRGTLLQVVVKRLGGDEIEEDLDLDAAEVEAVLFAVLTNAQCICVPEGVSTMIEDRGGRALGTAIITFRVKSSQPLAGGFS